MGVGVDPQVAPHSGALQSSRGCAPKVCQQTRKQESAKPSRKGREGKGGWGRGRGRGWRNIGPSGAWPPAPLAPPAPCPQPPAPAPARLTASAAAAPGATTGGVGEEGRDHLPEAGMGRNVNSWTARSSQHIAPCRKRRKRHVRVQLSVQGCIVSRVRIFRKNII